MKGGTHLNIVSVIFQNHLVKHYPHTWTSKCQSKLLNSLSHSISDHSEYNHLQFECYFPVWKRGDWIRGQTRGNPGAFPGSCLSPLNSPEAAGGEMEEHLLRQRRSLICMPGFLTRLIIILITGTDPIPKRIGVEAANPLLHICDYRQTDTHTHTNTHTHSHTELPF